LLIVLGFNNIFLLKFKEIDDFHSKWVKKVSLKKIYPDKVELCVYERKPLFRIKSGSSCYYLTDDLNRIESDCENINVIVEEPLSNHLLLGLLRYISILVKTFIISNYLEPILKHIKIILS